MDKNLIKQYLTKTFIKEASKDSASPTGFPAAKLSKEILKKDKEQNTQGVKDVIKNVASQQFDELKPDPNAKDMAENEFNYHNKSDEKYHDEMEIMNGQEMIQYNDIPDETFKKRALEAIEGSSRMGNNPEWANVVEKPWGGSPDFGKKLVKRIKDSEDKRNEQTPSIRMQGKDIQADKKDYGHKPYAFENQDKNKPQIKETMKRLKFKKEFNGVGNALKLIPESYREDKKVFEMTDGNENYRIRWEGTKDQGNAVILQASDKKLVNEDVQKMKALMNYRSENTLGLIKGKDRITENASFEDIWKKTKALLESKDIEDSDAPEGNLEDVDPGHAPEAKKDVNGKETKDKGTTAPAPKNGHLDKTGTKLAPEAKKDIEGTTSSDKGTTAPAPKTGHWTEINKGTGSVEESAPKIKGATGLAPKEGHWADIDPGHAPEAKQDVEGTTSDDPGIATEIAPEGLWHEISNGDGSETTDDSANHPDPKEGPWHEALKSKAKKALAAEGLKKKSSQITEEEITEEDLNEEDHIKKGKFTAWCKARGHDGPSKECAREAMASNSTSAHKMATFYTNTVKP